MTTTAATDADDEGSGAHPRFAAALEELGLGELHSRIRRFPDATRTAAEAAAAVGCELSQICKSLIFTVFAAVFAHEVPDRWGAAGVALTCAGITGVALWGLRGRRPDWAAIGAALATGLSIAAYTVVDGLGVRASGSPVGYTAWLMVIQGVAIPAYAVGRWRGETAARLRPFALLGLFGAVLSVCAYGLVLWAQTRAEPAPIAALRESSVNPRSSSNNFAGQGAG
ncbi:EamA family transporter [Streptomyces olivochromogenes]|uniref:EamA family transporter n=1 Tax=Streptomyces olivochromogenes TaxID=1963 RepID=UPI001F412157|nr:EamA family transporter [Streptomyces olivochromogenes]